MGLGSNVRALKTVVKVITRKKKIASLSVSGGRCVVLSDNDLYRCAQYMCVLETDTGGV